MSWNRSRPNGGKSNPKYKTPEHLALRKALLAELKANGIGRCCIGGEPIYPGQALHLDHTPDGLAYRGLACAHHNRSDGAKRARAKQDRPRPYRGFTRSDW